MSVSEYRSIAATQSFSSSANRSFRPPVGDSAKRQSLQPVNEYSMYRQAIIAESNQTFSIHRSSAPGVAAADYVNTNQWYPWLFSLRNSEFKPQLVKSPTESVVGLRTSDDFEIISPIRCSCYMHVWDVEENIRIDITVSEMFHPS